uniref:LCP family protein n=1 Tax=Acetatifactor sp. TaxID=1872090 RepID=UPI0040571497
MKINAKVYRIMIKMLIVVVLVVVVAVVGFLILQILGRNRLYDHSGTVRPDLSISELTETIESDSEEVAQSVQKEEDSYVWQEGDVRYNGIIYRYNEEILTFLFMGIDKMTEVKPVKGGIDGGQADAIFLLVLNPDTKEASVIGIPRDTMTAVEVYSEEGKYRGTDIRQLCLQHGYGDGAELSCERSVTAVSKLFYNLPIHGYCAINMGAIPLINDAVGGVELIALENVYLEEKKNSISFDVKEGEELHLEGTDAYAYLRGRDMQEAYSAAGRLERQKQYLTAYADKALQEMKSDITLPVTLYKTLSKYMVTDVTVDEVSYLATQVADYHFSDDNMYSLKGEIDSDGRYEEFYVDETALYELILNVFYEEVNEFGIGP